MIPSSEIVSGAQAILDEGCGYVWGTYGQTWTQADQDAVNNGKKMTGPPAQTEKTKQYAKKWIGRRVFDCSGLWYYLMGLWGAYVPHGSNSIWNSYCVRQGKIKNGVKQAGGELLPGTAVFLYKATENNRHHIGVYIGNGKCIEAKGTYYGVVYSDISHWDEWGEVNGIDYGGGHVSYPVVKYKCVGPEVVTVQTLLNGWGYSLDVDGAFGTKTESTVKAFQQRMNLTPDGVVGEKTWTALVSNEPEKPEVPDEPEEEYLEIRNPKNGQTSKLSMSAARELHDALRVAGIR